MGYPRRPITDRTKALDFSQVALLANAHAFAASDHVQRPLNVLLTIVWRHSQRWSGLECWPRLQTRVMDQLTRWLRRNGIDTAFVWTRETAPGKGAHTHVAIHLGSRPERVRDAMIEWLVAAFAFGPEGIDVSCGAYGAQTEGMRAGILRYLVKGIDHRMFRYVGFETSNVAAELGIDHRGQQGKIEIKRSGTSQNISSSARQAAGWQEIRGITNLADVFRPSPRYQCSAPPAPSWEGQEVADAGVVVSLRNTARFVRHEPSPPSPRQTPYREQSRHRPATR